MQCLSNKQICLLIYESPWDFCFYQGPFYISYKSFPTCLWQPFTLLFLLYSEKPKTYNRATSWNVQPKPCPAVVSEQTGCFQWPLCHMQSWKESSTYWYYSSVRSTLSFTCHLEIFRKSIFKLRNLEHRTYLVTIPVAFSRSDQRNFSVWKQKEVLPCGSVQVYILLKALWWIMGEDIRKIYVLREENFKWLTLVS